MSSFITYRSSASLNPTYPIRPCCGGTQRDRQQPTSRLAAAVAALGRKRQYNRSGRVRTHTETRRVQPHPLSVAQRDLEQILRQVDV